MKHGIGRLVYSDGGYYEGKWVNDSMEGYGQLYYSNGNLAYEGFWRNDKFNGEGKFYNDCPDHTGDDQPIDYLNFDNFEEKWHCYEGEFLDGKRCGKGTMRFVNG
jgi:hypothetical protein